jgi:hypothetical protein
MQIEIAAMFNFISVGSNQHRTLPLQAFGRNSGGIIAIEKQTMNEKTRASHGEL